QPQRVDATDGEPRLLAGQFGGGAHQLQARRRAARLGGGGPAGADAEVVDVVGDRGGDLFGVVRGPADQRPGTHDLARHRQRQVVLAQVQHVGTGGAGDIGAIVDRDQGRVPAGDVG